MYISRLRNSFTILEMAAVLTVISLLMAASFKGKSLLDNAKLSAIMADVKSYSSKSTQFAEQYQSLPGDLANATSFWASANNGNGNGMIDSSSEALSFWQHLQFAGLITGNFDGTSSFVAFDANNPSVAGGIVKSSYNGGIYSINNNASYGLTIRLSGLSSSNYTTAILTPEAAYNLDKKYDDGNPNSGMIVAYSDPSLAATACITGGGYNFATPTASCYLEFYIAKKTLSSAINLTGCNGSPLGSTRISSSKLCPDGFSGYVLDSCVASSGGSLSWQQYRSYCEPISCGSGKTAGDTMLMSCAPGYAGVGNVTYTCSNYGIFYPSDVSACSNTGIGACVANSTRVLPCPIGYSGTWSQTCSNSTPGSWIVNNFSSSCTKISCAGGAALGTATSSGAVSSPCTTTYNSFSNPSGYATDLTACSLPVTTTANLSTPTASYVLKNQYCAPTYSTYSTCTPSTTKNDTCPKGQMGAINQLCNVAGNFESVSNSCTQTNCGGEPIGATRPAHGIQCPYGSLGVPLEICSHNDITNYKSANWQVSYIACNIPTCSATDAGLSDGYASWPATTNGNAATGSCDVGYSSSGTPTRVCSSSGSWGTITNPCTNCAAITSGDPSTATWTATPYINGNTYTGTCPAGYSGSPTKTCSNGAWGPTLGTCVVANCPAITTATSSTGYATYSSTPPGINATGICESGYTGTPKLQCQSNGTWTSTASVSCSVACDTTMHYYTASSFITYEFSVTVPTNCHHMTTTLNSSNLYGPSYVTSTLGAYPGRVFYFQFGDYNGSFNQHGISYAITSNALNTSNFITSATINNYGGAWRAFASYDEFYYSGAGSSDYRYSDSSPICSTNISGGDTFKVCGQGGANSNYGTISWQFNP